MTGTITCTVAGVRWSLRPDVFERRDELFGAEGLRLAEWLAAGTATVLKQAGHRAVYRVVLPGLDFHLKQYPGGGLKSLLRTSPARAEYDRAVTLAALQVPAVEAMAVGTPRFGAGASYLLTRTVPQSRSLSAFLETELHRLPPRRQTRLRQRIAVAMGRLLAKMHDAGAVHDDLHPANILLRLTEDDEPLLCLVDLLDVRIGRPLDTPARRDNLVILNRWFALRSAPMDRLRFWRAYNSFSRERSACAAAALAERSRLSGPELEQRTALSNQRFWREQDRRCLKSNRYFRRVRQGDISGHAVAELTPDILAPFLANPDDIFRRPDVKVLKDSRSSTVVELELPGADGPRRVIFKRFAVTAWSDPWAALFRPAPALRSYVLGHALRVRGLPTPRPLLVLHRRRHGLLREGYLLTEKVPEAMELNKYVRSLDAKPADERRRILRRLIDRVARLVRTLHERGLTHRDLKAPNLLVSPTGWSLARSAKVWLGDGHDDGDGPHVWFVDLVGVRRQRHPSHVRLLQNVTRLHASFVNIPGLSPTDKARFLRIYLAGGQRGATSWKCWWREIATATAAKVERNRRVGRIMG
jgi:tRNA A-37 threonylcarbamoyl transferase component Bud32